MVTLSLSNNDPETIKITNNAIPGVSQSNQIISSHGSTDNIICILPNSRLSVISGFLEGKIHQYEVANVPDMPDNACVQTRGPYSAIYWSERTEDGAMGQLLMIHHTKQSLEIASRVRFDSLIQKITFSNVKSNLMWCIEIPDPRSPSTLKLTQFLVKEKGLKVFDSDESKEFLVQLSSSVITSSFSPNDEKILFGCSGKVLKQDFIRTEKSTFQTFDSFFTSLGRELSNDTHIMGQYGRYCWKICVRKFEKKNEKKVFAI